ncbi:MAG: FAD-dependent oxidoreductase [Armatimonadetes bacterium]|nr:FAD-dependent oxidoreductase [Armatimonadota bacterium]
MEMDVVVVGGGVAGIAAATEAARGGADVLLVDENRALGGALAPLGDVAVGPDATAASRLRETMAAETRAAGVTVLGESLLWGIFDGRQACVLTPGENLDLVPSALVLATGAADRPLPFPGWEIPTVMTAQDMLRMVSADAAPGRHVLIASAGGWGVEAALALRAAGIGIAAFLESGALEGGARDTLRAAGIPVHENAVLSAAHGTEYVQGARFHGGGVSRDIKVDAIALAFGAAPLAELFWIAGCEMAWNAAAGGHVPVRNDDLETSVPGIYAAGAAGGLCGLSTAIAEGRVAGAAAAVRAGKGDRGSVGARRAEANAAREREAPAIARALGALWALETDLVGSVLSSSDAPLCRCEKVSGARVRAVIEGGAQTASEVKRITRAGMGECQGRNCRPLLSRAVALLTKSDVALAAPITFRPPVRPVPLEALLRGKS